MSINTDDFDLIFETAYRISKGENFFTDIHLGFGYLFFYLHSLSFSYDLSYFNFYAFFIIFTFLITIFFYYLCHFEVSSSIIKKLCFLVPVMFLITPTYIGGGASNLAAVGFYNNVCISVILFFIFYCFSNNCRLKILVSLLSFCIIFYTKFTYIPLFIISLLFLYIFKKITLNELIVIFLFFIFFILIFYSFYILEGTFSDVVMVMFEPFIFRNSTRQFFDYFSLTNIYIFITSIALFLLSYFSFLSKKTVSNYVIIFLTILFCFFFDLYINATAGQPAQIFLPLLLIYISSFTLEGNTNTLCKNIYFFVVYACYFLIFCFYLFYINLHNIKNLNLSVFDNQYFMDNLQKKMPTSFNYSKVSNSAININCYIPINYLNNQAGVKTAPPIYMSKLNFNKTKIYKFKFQENITIINYDCGDDYNKNLVTLLDDDLKSFTVEKNKNVILYYK